MSTPTVLFIKIMIQLKKLQYLLSKKYFIMHHINTKVLQREVYYAMAYQYQGYITSSLPQCQMWSTSRHTSLGTAYSLPPWVRSRDIRLPGCSQKHSKKRSQTKGIGGWGISDNVMGEQSWQFFSCFRGFIFKFLTEDILGHYCLEDFLFKQRSISKLYLDYMWDKRTRFAKHLQSL